jgi:hypothetical protein
MRQAGIIAAAGIVALDSMVERLQEDHRRVNAIGKGEQYETATTEGSFSDATGCLASQDIPYLVLNHTVHCSVQQSPEALILSQMNYNQSLVHYYLKKRFNISQVLGLSQSCC